LYIEVVLINFPLYSLLEAHEWRQLILEGRRDHLQSPRELLEIGVDASTHKVEGVILAEKERELAAYSIERS
jgi:hypothetical protein